ncbi:MAG TPA: MBOAT family O-acyltransferase [Anaerolineales bacterium]|nr:MBOAT family O-acyltransferase [Anaerolineales bacterium]
MTINQILIVAAAALLWGLVMRERGRLYFILTASVVVIFWLQPALPLRGFDFWLPVLTLVLTVFSWYITATEETRRAGKNWVVLAIVVGVVLVLNLSRFLPFDSILTASRPPQIEILFLVLAGSGIFFFLITRLVRFNSALLSIGIVGLIAIFLAIKVPALAYWVSYGIRSLTNQSLAQASVTDLRWLGFSYVAFRIIHTLRDRQMGRLPAVDLAEYMTYVTFFPAFTAGPIDRIERFIQDLRRPANKLGNDELLIAGQRFMVGLFKKFVIADALALIALNDTNAIQVRSAGWTWILVYAYAFQIYFDFSGYTDIAIGISRLLGIQLPENFSAPYLKPNLTQFWNSWHMTLTQWFRAYFFNPATRWLRALRVWENPLPTPFMILLTQVATMVLIGFWHGVTWNFTLWGLWHGFGLFIHNRWSDLTRVRASAWAVTPFRQNALNISGVLITFHFVALGWIFFALSSTSSSQHVFLKLFGLR